MAALHFYLISLTWKIKLGSETGLGISELFDSLVLLLRWI